MKICITRLVMSIAFCLAVSGAFSSGIQVVLTGNTADMKDPKELFGLISQHVTTSYHKNPLTFGLRLGGGHAFGQMPFYKLFHSPS